MAWLDKLKLNKQLLRTIAEAGYEEPKEIQLKTLPRINGGQDLVAIGPEGCGKTTTYVLAVLNKLRHTAEGVPVVLILVPAQEHVELVIARFDSLNKNKAIRIVGLFPMPGMDAQLEALADGADIVVATPDRARAIYLKLALNLNKIELLIIDDAEQIVKQGLQLPVAELANSIVKCQHLVFATVLHDKLNKMIAPFMKLPGLVEVEEIGEVKLTTYPQVLYNVPNFSTKLNLLNLFMQDEELFNKTVVFVNTRYTAERIYKSLQNALKETVTVLNPWFTAVAFSAVNDFTDSAARVLIVANENQEAIDLTGVPFLLHFELPEEKETYIDRMINDKPAADSETLAITFATDLELSMVRKIEQATGQKIPVGELPEELLIEKDKKHITDAEKQAAKHKSTVPERGAAFHEKKASNAKTYNYSSGLKAKMNNKRKHS